MLNWIWHTDRWTQEPWTLWTAVLVHLSSAHALANLAALLSLLALGWAWRLGWATVWAALLAWPLTTASLALWPSVSSYAGLSGPLHALAAVLALHRLRGTWLQHGRVDRSAAALALGLGGKLVWEAAWVLPLGWDALWGFHVVYAAHLGGALCGVLCAALWMPRAKHRDTPQ